MSEEEWVIPDDPMDIRKLIEEVKDEEYRDELMFQFRHHAMGAMPVPQCCHEQRTQPSSYWSLDYDLDGETGSKEATGSWKAYLSFTELDSYYRSKLLKKYKDVRDWPKRPPAKFCAYCGEELSEMVRKKKFPKFTGVNEAGSGYCETCGERCICCYCWPPEFAWEPKW